MRRLLKYLSVPDIINLAYWIASVIIFVIGFRESDFKGKAILYFAILLGYLLLAVYIRAKGNKNKFEKLMLLLYPLIFLIVIFDTIHMIIPYVIGDMYDELLMLIDHRILGFHPTVAIEAIVSPVMTEIMYYLYALYFPMPFFILGYLYIAKKYIEMDKAIVFFLLTFYGSYLMYFLVPAVGPRFYEPMIELQTLPLDGLWLTDMIRDTINILENNKLDAFPSLHAAITLAVLIVMWQYRKKWLYFFIPVSVGLFVSLVYCRYHYVIDVLAGVIYTLVCFWITEKYHSRLLKKHFIPSYS